MADTSAKKLNLPLYLNPVVSQSDQVAMTALERWYEQTRQSCGGSGPELEGLIREFHRDLYLAGLHLYLINPRLCRHVADALQQADPTIENLDQQLKACGLWPSNTAITDEGVFSSVQLEQLQGLMGELRPAPESDPPSSALLKQMNTMEAELKQLRTLMEEQTCQLGQVKVTATAPAPEVSSNDGSEEMDVSGMADQIEKMQKIRKKGVF